MAIDETTTATLDPEVLYTKLDDGEAVLLHLGTTTYYTLNQTGARIWKLLGDGHSVQDVGRTLETDYEVTPEQALQSAKELTQDLVAEQLVHIPTN